MGIKFISVLKCAGLSTFLTALFVFAISLASYFTGINETTLTVSVYVSVVLAVFIGAFTCAHAVQSKSLLHVLLLSIIYYALLVAATIAINGAVSTGRHFFTMTAGIFASGILGAVLGK